MRASATGTANAEHRNDHRPDFLSLVRNQPGNLLSAFGNAGRVGGGPGGALRVPGPGVQGDFPPRRWCLFAQRGRIAAVLSGSAILSLPTVFAGLLTKV